eukprot:15325213-Ditylum_brightwellii.AAC.1
MNLLAEMLLCLKDQPDYPAEIKQANVPLSNVALHNLVMRSISTAMEDKYNCISDLILTNPDKMVETLSKIKKRSRTPKRMIRRRTALRAMVNTTNKVIAPRNTPKRASSSQKQSFQGRPFPKRKPPSCANCAK